MKTRKPPSRRASETPASKPKKRPPASTNLFTKGRKLPLIRTLENGSHVKVEYDVQRRGLVASVVNELEAKSIIDRQHPPVVVPIVNKRGWFILYTWDPARNQYDQGVDVPAGDSRLP